MGHRADRSTDRVRGYTGVSYHFKVTAYDNVNNTVPALKTGVTVKAVTKYYTLGGQKVAMRQGDEVYYLHGDHLGSTPLTTDSLGGVTSEVRTIPWDCPIPTVKSVGPMAWR